jgi:hypothetical protein
VRLHVTLSLELDEKRLEGYREELDAKGELDLFPGQPKEWTSILDLIDLIDHHAIVRTELLEVREGPAPFTVTQKEPSWLVRVFGRWHV